MATKRSADQIEAGRAFFRRLNDGELARVYVITGEERFLVHDAIRRVVERVFPSGRDDFNLAAFHGGEASGVDIAAAASQVPMFAAQRVVVVRGGESLSAADLDAVAGYVERAYDSTVLIIEASTLDARLKPVKRILSAAHVDAVELIALSPRDATAWAQKQARRHGAEIDGQVAGYLVDAVGADLSLLDMALERVALYAGDRRPVTLGDAEAVVPDTRSRNVFALVDHLGARELGPAIGCFHRLLDQGESPVGGLAMIARHFRALALARAAAAEGVHEQNMAQFIGCPPFKVRDYVATSRAYSPQKLATILHAIAETDLALKSSRVRRELLVERLFMRICSVGA